jgi:hypothetical protein
MKYFVAIFLITYVMVIVSFLISSRVVAYSDRKYYESCKEMGGIPYIGRTYKQCLHPSAVLKVE